MAMNDGLAEHNETVPASPAPSRLRSVFVGEKGIRTGWRLAIFLVLTAGMIGLTRAALLQIPSVAGLFNQNVLSPATLFWGEIPTAVCLLFGTWIMSRIEKRSVTEYGLSMNVPVARHLLVGSVWGLGIFSLVMALIWLMHGFSPGGLALHGFALLRYAALWAMGFALVGFVEEFLFRGYIQFTLASVIGFWPAAVLWSVVFGAVHLSNGGENLAGVTQVFLIAMLLCLTLRRTGALWFAMGLHAAGDFTETFIFSAPDSGLAASGSLLHSSFHGPHWLTGGDVGPEGSVFVLLVEGAAILLFHFLYPPHKSSEPGLPDSRQQQ